MTPTPTDLDLARRRMLTAERIVVWRRAAKQLAEALREAADRRAEWDAVIALARGEIALAETDLRHAERVHDATATEALP